MHTGRHGHTPDTGTALTIEGGGVSRLDHTDQPLGSTAGAVPPAVRCSGEAMVDDRDPFAARLEDTRSLRMRNGGR